jgi:hypothetical protein
MEARVRLKDQELFYARLEAKHAAEEDLYALSQGVTFPFAKALVTDAYSSMPRVLSVFETNYNDIIKRYIRNASRKASSSDQADYRGSSFSR